MFKNSLWTLYQTRPNADIIGAGDTVFKKFLLVISLLVQSQAVLAEADSLEEMHKFCEKMTNLHQLTYDSVSPCCPGYTLYNKVCYLDEHFKHYLPECMAKKLEMDVHTGACIEDKHSAATSKTSLTGGGTSTWNQCKEAYESAAGACDLDRNQKSAIDTAVQMANQAPTLTHDNCSVWGEISQAANAGLGIFKGYCSTGYSSCSTACKNELHEVRTQRDLDKATDFQVSEVMEYKRKCEGLSANLAEAAGLMQQFMVKDAQMKLCAPGTTMQQKCAANPSSSPMCSLFVSGTDCGNPQTAATNVVCLCRSPGSQSLPQCQALAKGGVPMSGLGTASATGIRDGTGNDLAGALGKFGGPGGGFGGGGDGIVMGDGKPNPADGNSLVRPAGGKANLGDNGSGNKPPGNNGSGGDGGGGGYNTKIIGGYGFGGNGPSGSSGGSGSPSYGYSGQNGNGYGQNGRGQKVDLRQFLPGGRRDPSRGLAGISGPDGITGPNSSIWKKINARYYAVSPTLLP